MKLGYKFDSLENKVKTITEFLHNHNNLRTLCKDCHKGVTKEFLRNKYEWNVKVDMQLAIPRKAI
jgi:5-methylcytosine-specific restriction endonuclease McrA